MKKRLPIIIDNCFQCPYFHEGKVVGLSNFKERDTCNYGKFYFIAEDKFPVNCPLADWQEITLPG